MSPYVTDPLSPTDGSGLEGESYERKSTSHGSSTGLRGQVSMLERVTLLPRLRPSNPSDPARGQASDFGLVADARLPQDDSSVSQRRLHTTVDCGHGTLFMRYEVQAT
jgi:hypothetical protein